MLRRARCFSQAKLVPAVKPHTHSNGARDTALPSAMGMILPSRSQAGRWGGRLRQSAVT